MLQRTTSFLQGDSIARGSARQVDDSHLVIDAVVHDDDGPPPCAIDHVALDVVCLVDDPPPDHLGSFGIDLG